MTLFFQCIHEGIHCHDCGQLAMKQVVFLHAGWSTGAPPGTDFCMVDWRLEVSQLQMPCSFWTQLIFIWHRNASPAHKFFHLKILCILALAYTNYSVYQPQLHVQLLVPCAPRKNTHSLPPHNIHVAWPRCTLCLLYSAREIRESGTRTEVCLSDFPANGHIVAD